jgi:hypothetical protein
MGDLQTRLQLAQRGARLLAQRQHQGFVTRWRIVQARQRPDRRQRIDHLPRRHQRRNRQDEAVKHNGHQKRQLAANIHRESGPGTF